jgi:NNP family nitrate/nitrite transporter-like MFS transporter
VGGLVGVIGGLGGFACPILFGMLLDWSGVWTTCWMVLFGLSVLCFLWMHRVIRGMMRSQAPELSRQAELFEPAKIHEVAGRSPA